MALLLETLTALKELADIDRVFNTLFWPLHVTALTCMYPHTNIKPGIQLIFNLKKDKRQMNF